MAFQVECCWMSCMFCSLRPPLGLRRSACVATHIDIGSVFDSMVSLNRNSYLPHEHVKLEDFGSIVGGSFHFYLFPDPSLFFSRCRCLVPHGLHNGFSFCRISQSTKGLKIIGVFWAMTGLTLAMVVSRLYIRANVLRNMGSDDWLIAASMMSFVTSRWW